MKFTRERPKTQHILVTGQSDQQPIEFVGVFRTFDKEKLTELKAKISSIQGLNDGDIVYDEIADEIFVGWANVPGRETIWVTDDDGQSLECTAERRAELLTWPSVTYCLVNAFYRAMFSESLSLGNLPPSPGNGFKQRVAAASRPTT